MTETEWAKFVAERLKLELPTFKVEAGKKLTYANEIIEYNESHHLHNIMAYETDILVYEVIGDKAWKPRVVIETKINSVTTHDAITYSQKSAAHKFIHPYLRYGIFIGNRENNPLPGRLFRHGENFDFMLSWKGYEPLDYEWDTFIDILNKEVVASKQLEEMIFNTRSKDRGKFFALHKPLVTNSVK